MKLFATALAALLLCCATARADERPDMTKQGPLSRKVAKEKEARKGIEALFKALEAAMKKGDINAYADLMDFPLLVVSDDAQGKVSAREVSREEFIKAMGPYMAQPKDVKLTHKHSVSLMSDVLASVEEENGMSLGKVKGAWHAQSLVVQREGKWLFKSLVEAGWGDLFSPAAPAQPAPAQPAPAPAPK